VTVAADPIRQLAGVVDAVCATDPAVLGAGDTLVALHRQLERLEAAATRATAAFDAGRSWEADGARSAAAWVSTRCRLPVTVARRRVRVGRSLRSMPGVEVGWLAGDLGAAQVNLLADARTPATAECFARDEPLLCGQAADLTYRQFARVLAYWAQRADPDGADASAEAQHSARRLHLSRTYQDGWVLDGLFDPVNGSIVSRALGRIEQELFAADWAEAKEVLGDAVCAEALARTPAQRRADALVEMARRAMAVAPGARLPEPLFSVLVGYETFAGRICELADATVVAPGALVRWLEEAWVERVVFDAPDRVRSVGVRRRIFSGATRRAVQVRDRQCYSEFCDVAADGCEIDHIQPWAAGGLTVEGNGRAACGWHNRHRHRPSGPSP